MCKSCDGHAVNTSIVVTVESDRTCVIVGVAGAGTKVASVRTFWKQKPEYLNGLWWKIDYSLGVVVGTRPSTRAVVDLGGESGEQDEHPSEPEQREESDTSRAPINRAECVQAQTD